MDAKLWIINFLNAVMQMKNNYVQITFMEKRIQHIDEKFYV